jgi:acetyltransferase-like isoleucine patch superfamily enzyme
MRELKYQARYALPMWLCTLLTDWLPENRITQRLRGEIISRIVGSGRRLRVASGVRLIGLTGLTFGDNVYIGPSCWVNGLGGVTIEDEVMLGPYVCVTSTVHGFAEGSVARGGTHLASVKIGSGSWLGAHVSVAAGASIGSGCIVGANAVVTTQLPDDTVSGGVPAKVLRSRSDNPGSITARADLDI